MRLNEGLMLLGLNNGRNHMLYMILLYYASLKSMHLASFISRHFVNFTVFCFIDIVCQLKTVTLVQVSIFSAKYIYFVGIGWITIATVDAWEIVVSIKYR